MAVRRGQGGAARGQVPPLGVKEAKAQGPGGSGAAVDGGTAPHAHDDVPVAGVQGGSYDLADALRGGPTRVVLFLAQEPESRGAGHFHDGGLGVSQHSPLGGDGFAQGTAGQDVEAAAPGGLDENIQGIVAAVGHGESFDLGLGHGVPGSLSHGLGRLVGGKGAFKGLRRTQNFQRVVLIDASNADAL